MAAVLLLLNVGLFLPDLPFLSQLLTGLQFDSAAICQGEWWRLLTFNLVHWTPRHFALNLFVFLGVGLIYERLLRAWYPWLLCLSGAAIGLGLWLCYPSALRCRGLSGVVACQVAAALWVEVGLARGERRRWLWLAPVVGLLVVWLLYKWYTFGTTAIE
jgi:membrane associated rhomboid family serine protease